MDVGGAFSVAYSLELRLRDPCEGQGFCFRFLQPSVCLEGLLSLVVDPILDVGDLNLVPIWCTKLRYLFSFLVFVIRLAVYVSVSSGYIEAGM
jgi:hypothetical protein